MKQKNRDRAIIWEGILEYDDQISEREKEKAMKKGIKDIRTNVCLLLRENFKEHSLLNELEAINEKTDIKKLVEMLYFINILTKRHRLYADELYEIKDGLIDLIVFKAENGALPENHWGYGYDDEDQLVFYFDIPGVGQLSFHKPIDLNGYPFDIPPYRYEWTEEAVPLTYFQNSRATDPIHLLINQRAGIPIDRNAAMRAAHHPKFQKQQQLLEKFSQKVSELPPEILDLAA